MVFLLRVKFAFCYVLLSEQFLTEVFVVSLFLQEENIVPKEKVEN